jgi:four helix bundle protein
MEGIKMTVVNYRDLIVWKRAFDLSIAIYQTTQYFPAEVKFGITSQLRSACISVPSNIAEGEGRNSKGEFRHFLSIAMGSLRESETQILLCEAWGYFNPNQSAKLMAMAAEVGRLINGLSRSLLNR